MKKRNMVVAVAILTFAHIPAHAAQRAFVSTAGIDNPGCSVAAPCRTFAAAITAVDPDGEVVALDSGGFGTFTTTKSFSIVAAPGAYVGISAATGNAITIAFPAIVSLRGITIQGLGGAVGVALQNAKLRLERCSVTGFTSHGVFSSGPAGELEIVDSAVRNNGGDGIRVVGIPPSVELTRVRVENNAGIGLNIVADTGASIRDSEFVRNGQGGIAIANAGLGSPRLSVSGSRITGAPTSSNGIIVQSDLGAITTGVVSDVVVTGHASGISATAANASTVALEVTRAVVDAEGRTDGIHVTTLSGGAAQAMVADSTIAGGQFGIYVNGGTVVAVRNRIMRSANTGMLAVAGSFIHTGMDNVIEFYGAAPTAGLLGAIVPVGGPY